PAQESSLPPLRPNGQKEYTTPEHTPARPPDLTPQFPQRHHPDSPTHPLRFFRQRRTPRTVRSSYVSFSDLSASAQSLPAYCSVLEPARSFPLEDHLPPVFLLPCDQELLLSFHLNWHAL